MMHNSQIYPPAQYQQQLYNFPYQPQQQQLYTTYPVPPQNLSKNTISSDTKLRFNNSCSVYVGDIPKEMELDELVAYFQKYGIRDSFIKKSAEENKHAYFRLESEEKAAAAKRDLNHKEIRGKQLRVIDYKNLRELSEKGNLFIKGHEGIDIEEFDMKISKLSCFTSSLEDHKGERVARYNFFDEEEYQRITSLSGINLHNNTYPIERLEDASNNKSFVVSGLSEKIQIFEVDRAIMDLMSEKRNIIFSSKKRSFDYICVQFHDEERALRLIGREVYLTSGLVKINKFVSASKSKLTKDNVLHIKNARVSIEVLEDIIKKYIFPPEEFYVISKEKKKAKIHFSDSSRIETFKQLSKKDFDDEIVMSKDLKKSKYNLHTYNLRQCITEGRLTEAFKVYGEISSCLVVLYGRNDLPLRTLHAYIRFKDKKTEDIVREKAPDNEDIKALYEGHKVKFSKKFEKPIINQSSQINQGNYQNYSSYLRPEAAQNPVLNQRYSSQQMQYIPQQQSLSVSYPPTGHNQHQQYHHLQYQQQPQVGYYQGSYNQGQHSYGQTQTFKPHQNNEFYSAPIHHQRQRPNQTPQLYQVPLSQSQQPVGGIQANQQALGRGNAPNNNNHANYHQVQMGNPRHQQPAGAANNNVLPIQPKVKTLAQPDFQNNLKDIFDHHDKFERNSEELRRQILGSHIFKKISEIKPNNPHIPKITGMLIDKEVFSIEEILELLTDRSALEERVNEALGLISEQSN